MRIRNIYDFLNGIAPIETEEPWDNAGLLVGNMDNEIKKVMISLDITMNCIEEAHNNGCNLIISHHPIIFGKINSVLSDDITGSKILKLAEYGISTICMHTNLDKVLVNEVLIKKLGAFTYCNYEELMRIGFLENSVKLKEYLEFCKAELNNTGLRYYDSGRDVYKIACVGGSGADLLKDAYNEGCDTFITSDVKHNQWLEAQHIGINLIDADHFNTENVVIPVLRDMLENEFADTEFVIAESNKQVVEYA